MKAILGTKIGMTQLFGPDGKAIPVTLIYAEPNVVTQVKSTEKDGYRAVQVGVGTKRVISKPLTGHLKKAGLASAHFLREFRLTGQGLEDGEVDAQPGAKIDLSAFQEGDRVQVTGVSKGKGFAGVIKRHGFHGSPATHGTDHQRQPGSIGPQRPQRVIKGKKLPGRLGGATRTVKNLKIIKVDPERQLLAIRGAVPGPNKSLVIIRGQV